MFLPALDRRWWVILNVSIGIFMSTLDASIVNISLPTITQALNTDVKAVAWVVMAYLIVITSCLLLMGGLADLYGQRRVYLWGFFTFTLGSILCGLSPDIYFLIGSRMIQGLGASALIANGTAIITIAFPDQNRGQALGIIGSIVSIGFLTGPLIGGVLVEHVGWRSIFFINGPIGLAGIFLSLKVLEKDRLASTIRIDLSGALLFFAFIVSLLLFLNGISLGPNPLPWGWFLLSLGLLGLFIAVELRSPYPLVDLHLFRRRLFVSSLAASLLSLWVNAAHNFVIPFFLQDILGFSPSKVGMLVFPVSLTVMVIAPLGGRISDRIGVRAPATVGLMVISATIFSFYFLRGEVSDYDILWRQIVLGIGIGFFAPANNSAIIGSLPRERVGLASSFLALSRNLGIVMGVAFAEMVIALKSSSNLSGAGKGVPSLGGIQDVWRFILFIGMVGALLSWTRKRPL